jgi:hypothetical protein
MPLLESPVTLIEAFDGHRRNSPQKIRCSPLEGEGFEPSVPLATVSLILAEEKGLQADPARAGTVASDRDLFGRSLRRCARAEMRHH